MAKKKRLRVFMFIASTLAVIGLGYRYGTPLARFRRDAKNASTPVGAGIRDYVAENNSTIADVIEWHITNVDSPSSAYAAYVKKGWALRQ